MKINLAYQVYSARDEAEKDLLSVLKELKKIGYDGVEFAGFYGHSADEVAAYLRETGLKALSSHVPFDLIQGDPQGTIDYHKQIGCPFIAIPFLGDATRPGAKLFAKTIREIYAFGKLCAEAGITLLYHNHDFEFVEVSGQYGLDFLYDAVPAEYLQTELDTCWINIAGENPADFVRKYAGRCPVIHLKDFVGTRQGLEALYALIREHGPDNIDAQAQKIENAFDFRPVGYGVQDIPSIVKAGLDSGATWFVVEQDRSSERPALEAAKLSCEYVRAL
jgi:sugar phosphate isomerase/epimerase